MKELRIKIHSFSDVITNSSTTIYVMTHGKSIQLLKEFVDYLLKQAGSDKKSDDLFYFKVELDDSYLEDKFHELDTVDKSVQKKIDLAVKTKDYSAARKMKVDYVREKIQNNEIAIEDEEDRSRENHLVLIPKTNTKESKDITALVQAIFNIEESYD